MKDDFGKSIEKKEKLRIKGKAGNRSIWAGFGVFGIIGWSIALPTLGGAALGTWIDSKMPSDHSWTLALLIAGLVLGCANAWRWIAREQKEINEDTDKDTREKGGKNGK